MLDGGYVCPCLQELHSIVFEKQWSAVSVTYTSKQFWRGKLLALQLQLVYKLEIVSNLKGSLYLSHI